MQVPRVAHVLVALLVVCSGCSALTGPTPTGTPTDTPTPTPARANLDADAVVAAHLAALNASGSFRSTYHSVTDGRERHVNHQVYAVDADANRRLYRQASLGDGWRNRTTYTNGSRTYYRYVEVEDERNVTYDRLFPHPPDVGPVDVETARRGAILRAAVSSIEWRRANSTAGATRYVASGVERFPGEPLQGGVRLAGEDARANATLVVGESGVVRLLVLEFTGVRHDEAVVTRRLEIRFDRVGEPVARQPGWVEHARQVEPEVQRVHHVTVENGREVTANASVVVRRDGSVLTREDLTLAPGEDRAVLAATGVGNYTVVVRAGNATRRESFVRTNRTRNCFGDRFLRFTVVDDGIEFVVGAETGGCPY